MTPFGRGSTATPRAAAGWVVFHPILWALQPIAFLYARAVHEVSAVDILAPVGAALAGAVLTWAAATMILRRDFRKGACLSSVLLVLFFSFGRVVGLADRFFEATGLWPNLEHMHLATRTLSLQAFVLAVFAVVIVGMIVRLGRRKPLSEKITPLMAHMAAVLLVVSTVEIALGFLAVRRPQAPPAAPPAASRTGQDHLPDIYIIVVDAYARADVLKECYGFENGPFLAALSDLGFAVTTRSSANYPLTFLSLASALNMTSLENLAREAGPRSRSQKKAQNMIRNNGVMAFLKGRGYRTIHLASAWAGTRANPYADEVRTDHVRVMDDDFTRALVDTSLLVLYDSRWLEDMALFYREQFTRLEETAAEPGPKMVFCHFLLPHHPYVFDRNGAVVSNGSFVDNLLFRKAQWRRSDAYVEQLVFLNARLLEAFRSILAASPAPPVIVLFSDHGPLAATPDAEAAKRAQLDNLIAALLPGAPAGLLPDDTRLINLFPVVLNHYFDAGFAMRDDARFYSTFKRPYVLEPLDPK
jgi:hypothetical protein